MGSRVGGGALPLDKHSPQWNNLTLGAFWRCVVKGITGELKYFTHDNIKEEAETLFFWRHEPRADFTLLECSNPFKTFPFWPLRDLNRI